MTDLEELLKRISQYGYAFKAVHYKAPLFRLTPHEHGLLKEHLLKLINFLPEYYGELPTYMGVNFELVGKPILFHGAHIRSDSGIPFGEYENE